MLVCNDHCLYLVIVGISQHGSGYASAWQDRSLICWHSNHRYLFACNCSAVMGMTRRCLAEPRAILTHWSVIHLFYQYSSVNCDLNTDRHSYGVNSRYLAVQDNYAEDAAPPDGFRLILHSDSDQAATWDVEAVFDAAGALNFVYNYFATGPQNGDGQQWAVIPAFERTSQSMYLGVKPNSGDNLAVAVQQE